MRRTLVSFLFLLLGLSFLVFLIWKEGAEGIFALLQHAGWPLLWLLPVHVVVIGLDAVSWRWLLGGQERPCLFKLTCLALLREAINALLPVARIGGELVGVRLLSQMGVSLYRAAASVLVEVSLTLLSQFFFTVLGVLLLLMWISDLQVLKLLLIPLLLSLPILLLIFWLLGRANIFQSLQRLLFCLGGEQGLLRLPGDPALLDQEVQRLYARRWQLLIANAWQLASLFAGALEVWLSFRLLHHPISLTAAVLLESLGQALRNVSFFIPASLGVQEGGFVLFGAIVGVGPELALAYSLVRRFRELLLGIPLLLSWYLWEGKLAITAWQGRRVSGGSRI